MRMSLGRLSATSRLSRAARKSHLGRTPTVRFPATSLDCPQAQAGQERPRTGATGMPVDALLQVPSPAAARPGTAEGLQVAEPPTKVGHKARARQALS